MATYYVRPDGNNSNTGLGSGTGTAWQTLAKALGATGIGSGDTLYIAPGTYTESVTIGGTYTAPTYVYGDPLCQQFTGISAGSVRHSSASSTGNDRIINAILLSGSGKSNLNFRNIHWLSCNNFVQVSLLLGQNNTFVKCVFEQVFSAGPANCVLTAPSTLALNVLFDSCIFLTNSNGTGSFSLTGNNVADTSTVKNCLFIAANAFHGVLLLGTQCEVINCNFNNYNIGVAVSGGSATFVSSVKNCVFSRCATAVLSITLGHVTATYNRLCLSSLSNVATSVTNQTEGISGLDTGYSLLTGLQNLQFFSSYLGSPNTSAGIATGAPATDMYGVTWTGTSPDTGSATYRSLSAVGQYNPTERNASTITIAPGSTSQSIELYLGATGLTASTPGLSARYNRTRTASVSITLVARTIAQAWTAGGFAEVDATNMPGVYRLDLPDAALAAGADDVTIVVRGASGTNGAVMTVKLSSGGLTSAQTASAVWGASPSGYNDGTTFGGVVNTIATVANDIETEVGDIPIQVWDELKANHTIPNTFGDYLDTKVSTGADTARIQLRQGPFLIKQNAIDSVITEVNQFLSTVPNIEMVLIDSSGGSVSVAGATLVMRVRNQAGTAVVNNITPTVAYADGGVIRWSPNLSWNALTVTTAGTYRIVVERTMSGVTTTFGPFLVQLSSG